MYDISVVYIRSKELTMMHLIVSKQTNLITVLIINSSSVFFYKEITSRNYLSVCMPEIL